jgi:hypothetical protein
MLRWYTSDVPPRGCSEAAQLLATFLSVAFVANADSATPHETSWPDDNGDCLNLIAPKIREISQLLQRRSQYWQHIHDHGCVPCLFEIDDACDREANK